MDFDSLKILNNNRVSYESSDLTLNSQVNSKISNDTNTIVSEDKKLEDKKDDKAFSMGLVTKSDDEEIENSNLKGTYEEDLSKAVERMNKELAKIKREFSYSIHEQTNRIMVKITDSETGETVREIPSEKSLDLFAKLQEMAGILIDEKR